MKCGYLIIFIIVKCAAIDQNGTEAPPFQITEIEITKEMNFGANFAKTISGIFMMAANNVYFVNITKTEKRFDQIAKINDAGEDVTGFEAVSWEGRVILVVTHVDYFNVYLAEVVRSDALLSPIQKVAIFGKFVGALGFCDGGELFLVVGTNFTEAHGRLSLYKWDQSSFHLQEEKNLQSLSDLAVLTENSRPMIFTVRYGRRRSSKTSVQTFFVAEHKLQRTHNLYVDANLVLAAAQRGSSFILACSSRQKVCLSYAVADEELAEVAKETLNTTLRKLAYGRDFVLAEAPAGEFYVFKNLELKRSVKFKINETDFETASNLITTEDGEGQSFGVVAYVRPDKVLLKIFQIHLGPPEEENEHELKSPGRAIFGSFLSLQKNLLNRKNEIENIKNILGWRENLKSTEITVKKPFDIKSGNVKRVIVKNRNLLSLPELKKRLDLLRGRLQNLNVVNRKQKIKRSAGDDLKLKTLKVKNLLYNGTVFEGIEAVGGENKIILKSESVATKGIQFEKFERSVLREIPSTFIQENMTVEEIFVRKINGIDWNVFYEGVFLKNRDTAVEGDLIFKGPANFKTVTAEKINSRRVENLFTLKTDQEIGAEILASKVKATSIVAGDLNGIQFETDVASVGKSPRFIETPITARSIKIENELTLSKDGHKNLARHMARDFGQFLQLYKKKVKINGTLTVVDFDLDPEIEGLIDGKVFSPNFGELYWLKSVDQNFESVTFGGSVEAQKIQTDRLSGVNISSYLLNEIEPAGNVLLIINSAAVRGSVFNENEITPSKLLNLNSTTIRRGERAIFRDGVKEFAEVVKVDNLETEEINGKPVVDLIKKDLNEIYFSGTKEFSSIVVDGDFSTDHLKVSDFNGVDLEEFFKNSIDLKRNMVLKKLTLNGGSRFTNIFFDFLNNYDISKIMDVLEVTDDSKITLHKTITVEGDGVFEGGIETAWINDLNWNNYLKLIVFLNESTEIGGIKNFGDTLTVQDTARIAQINGVDAKEFFGGVLLKSRDQTIKNKWNFGSITFGGDLTAPLIDDIKTDQLIDKRDTSIKIEGDLIVEDLKISGSLYGLTKNNFGIDQIKIDISRFDQDYWKKIKVIKTVKFSSENNFYNYLIKNAVLTSADQVITGNLIFKKEIFFDSINSSHFIDEIDSLQSSCLLKRSPGEQVVVSKKKFLSDLSLKSAVAHDNFDADVVNNIDIFGFNSSIYRFTGNDVISGKKIFKNSPPTIDYLQIYGLLNNDDLRGIFQVTDFDSFLPPVRFIDLTIETPVSIKDVNGIDFDYFLNNRAKLEGEEQEIFGNLIFERLSLARNTTVASINNIDIIDIIEKSSKSLQEVYGEKKITGNFHLLGPAHVGHLNRVDFTGKFDNSVDLRRDYEIEQAVLNRALFDRGIKVFNSANGRPIDEYLFWYKIYNETVCKSFQEITDHLNLISTIANRHFYNARFLYLEHDISKNGIWGKYLKNPVKEGVARPTCLRSEPACLCGSSKLQIQISPSGRAFVGTPKNPILKSGDIDFRALAKNFCDRNSSASELSLSWDFGFYEKNITFNYFISDIQNFEIRRDGGKFLLIQFVLGRKNTPVILVKVDTEKNQILPIQSFREGVGFDLNFKVYTFTERIFVVMSTEKNLFIYEFQPENELFAKIQEISGFHNIFEMIKIKKDSFHLILTCRSCDTIAIYAANSGSAQVFEKFQNIRIRAKINELIPLIATHGKYFIAKMSAIEGFYHVFKFAKIQGWTLTTFGHFPDIEAIFPLNRAPNSGHDHLLVTSWNKSAILTLHSQG